MSDGLLKSIIIVIDMSLYFRWEGNNVIKIDDEVCIGLGGASSMLLMDHC